MLEVENKEKYFELGNIGLSFEDLDKILKVFHKFPEVEKVWLYGSRAKGSFKNYSDIDITIEGSDLDLQRKYLIALELDDLYLPYTFDISIKSQINNPDLLDHIQRVGKLLYQRQ